MRRQIDLLEEMTASELADLLAARPDLAHPRPASLQELSGRAAQHHSVVTAVHGLTAFKLAVVETLCVLEPSPPIEVLAEGLDVAPADIATALDALRVRLLAFQDNGRAQLLPVVRQVITDPLGLGPPVRAGLSYVPHHAVVQIAKKLGLRIPPGSKDTIAAEIEEYFGDFEHIARLVADAPTEVQQLLAAVGEADDDFVRVPPYLRWEGGPARSAVQMAQTVALLVPAGWDTLAVPREIGVCLRGGRLTTVRPQPPVLDVDVADPARAEAAAGGAAERVLAHLATLVDECAERPVAILKTGGIGVRELRRLGKRLEVDETTAARLFELAIIAGLIGISRKLDAVVPAAAADGWLSASPAARWVRVAAAWMATERYPSLAGSEGVDGKVIPALSGHGTMPGHRLRGEVLELLSRVPEHEAAAPSAVEAFLRWQFPRRFDYAPAPFGVLIGWVLAEAEFVGMTGDRSMTRAARALHRGDHDAAEVAAAAMLPAPLTTFTVQADLTAVVPGSLDPASAQTLADMADRESAGRASVWRFTEASVRRAFDRGHTAEELDGFLGTRAAHGVPQTLTYLIQDVARRHGHLRVAGGLTVVHGQDAALMTEVARHRKLAKLGLRLVAPTVAVTAKKPADTIAALQAAGYLPVPETESGAVAIAKPKRPRADVAMPGPTRAVAPASTGDVDELAAELLRRAQGEAPKGKPPPKAKPPPQDTRLELWDDDDDDDADDDDVYDDDELVVLIEVAIEAGLPISFGYRNAQGVDTVVTGIPVRLTEDAFYAITDRGQQTYLLDRIQWLDLERP